MDAKPVTICAGCQQAFDPEKEVEPLYKCKECDQSFGKSNGGGQGNRCESCHKFAPQDGETHAGCDVSVEEATEGFQCGKCGDATEPREEAEKCCVEEPDDPEPKPGDEPRAPKWTPEPFIAYIILRDAYMESRGRDDEPRYLDVAQKSRSCGVKCWRFRWNSLHFHQWPDPDSPYWHDGSGLGLCISDRATVDEKGIIHTKRIAGWKNNVDTHLGVQECEMLLQPVTQDELRAWRKKQEEKAIAERRAERKREAERRARQRRSAK